jgi:hypothetical protein
MKKIFLNILLRKDHFIASLIDEKLKIVCVGNPALDQAAQYAAVANHGYDMYKGTMPIFVVTCLIPKQ